MSQSAVLERVRQQRIASQLSHRVSRQTRSEVGGVTGSAGEVRAFRIKEAVCDATLCRTWNGSEEGDEDVIVLQPWLLRQTTTDRKQLYGEWFDWRGIKVDPLTLQPILDMSVDPPAEIVIFTPNFRRRIAFRRGDGRDRNGDRPIEWAVEEIFPPCPAGPDPDIPTGPDPAEDPPGIEYADPEIIFAVAISAQTVGLPGLEVTGKWLELAARMWTVVSRVEFNATPETP